MRNLSLKQNWQQKWVTSGLRQILTTLNSQYTMPASIQHDLFIHFLHMHTDDMNYSITCELVAP